MLTYLFHVSSWDHANFADTVPDAIVNKGFIASDIVK
jgi:hypothetical protein